MQWINCLTKGREPSELGVARVFLAREKQKESFLVVGLQE